MAMYGQQLAYVLFWCLLGLLQENLSVWFLLHLSGPMCTDSLVIQTIYMYINIKTVYARRLDI